MPAPASIAGAALVLTLAWPPAAPGAARPGPAAATAPSAVAAPLWLRAAMPAARLGGSGRFRYFGFHVYDARLWVTPAGYPAEGRWRDPQAHVPFALELQYARDFKGADIARSSREEMQSLGHGSEADLARWQAQMASVFPDVATGQRLTGVYQPGAGVRFYLDDRLQGEIAEGRFAHAFFAIWFDVRSRKAGLRAALLGPAAPERP